MTAPAKDWIEEGRKHFLASKTHPERPCSNYPTQDVHLPKDEADFIAGFNSAKAEWDRGEGLNGLSAYMPEMEESGQIKLTHLAKG